MKLRALFALLAVSALSGCAVSSEPITDEGAAANDEEAAKSRICPLYYDPVCGVDGKTYSNTCFAGKVKIAHKGECNACDTTKCRKNEHCELETVYCIKAPCPPVAKCVPNTPPVDACAVVRCAAGTICKVNEAGGAECVPVPKDFCNADADCKLVDNYCGGCECLPLATWATPPSCTDPVMCFAQPCGGKTVKCESNQCVVR